MAPSGVVGKDGVASRRLARSFSQCTLAERLVNAMVVVINSELFQLSRQVDISDQHMVKELPSYCANQPFHERIGHGYVRD